MGKKAISNRWIVVECLLIVLLFTLCMHENIVGFAYDSGVYWALAQSFWETGSFDFLSYPVSIRGYALPLFLGILQRIGVALFENPFVVFRLSYTMITVLLITVFIPIIMGGGRT